MYLESIHPLLPVAPKTTPTPPAQERGHARAAWLTSPLLQGHTIHPPHRGSSEKGLTQGHGKNVNIPDLGIEEDGDAMSAVALAALLDNALETRALRRRGARIAFACRESTQYVISCEPHLSNNSNNNKNSGATQRPFLWRSHRVSRHMYRKQFKAYMKPLARHRSETSGGMAEHGRHLHQRRFALPFEPMLPNLTTKQTATSIDTW